MRWWYDDDFWNSMCIVVPVVSIVALITMGVFFNEDRNQKKNSVCFNLLNNDYVQHVSYSQKPEYEYVRRNGNITQIQTINVFLNAVEHRENTKSFCTQCYNLEPIEKEIKRLSLLRSKILKEKYEKLYKEEMNRIENWEIRKRNNNHERV